MEDTLISLLTIAGGFLLGAIVLYFVVRAAVLSALRAHAFWRADGTYDVELQRHLRDVARASE